jgi:hypothetical protein
MKSVTHLAITLALCTIGTSILFAGGGVSRPPVTGEETFYTRPAMFSSRPSSLTTFVQSVERFGPVGIGIELHPPAFVMKVKNVEEGSPAAATGQLKAGMIIETINGEKLHDIDPRIQLGNIITQAEASDGKVVLRVRPAGSQSGTGVPAGPVAEGERRAGTPVPQGEDVVVTIPVLGAYSESWPLDCEKSNRIVRQLADRFAEEEWRGEIGLSGPKMLFMLSTGEKKDLDVVRGWIEKTIEKNQNIGEKHYIYQWFVSWGGPCLAEYYLRTGDESILPIMKKIADAVRKTMYHDAWGGRGVAHHHMGLAGTGTLNFLLLARQCGVDVEEGMLQAALQHFCRFAGKGVNPYMDGYPEGGTTDNGRNARLAFAMAAATALDPKGEESLYAMARDVAAMHSFYSGSYMNHGHTGGGIGEVWRSAAMGLLYEKRPVQYREFMNNRSWWLDMSRRYNGQFGILGGSNYDKESWGITMGLTYTVPRKKLCIFGAPRSAHAKSHKIPARAWGSAADDAFLSLEAAADRDGAVANLDGETFAEHSGVPMHRQISAPELSDEALLGFIRHAKHASRQGAARRIYKEMRDHLILDLLNDKDARVRHAGLMAMPMPVVSSRPERCDPGFPQEKVSEEMLARMLEILDDPDESWFVVDSVLQRLSRRSADELAPHRKRIGQLLGHDEWWVRHSALRAIVPLAVDARTYKKAMAAMEKHVPDFIRSPRWLADFSKQLADADPKVQQAGVATLGKIYMRYPGKSANPPGGLHPSGMSEVNYLKTVASALQSAPGGLDALYTVSRERYPNLLLPYKDLFLGSPNVDSNPLVKEALQAIIMEELIPEYVGRNLPNIEKAAKGGSVGGYRDHIMELTRLYARAGVDGYAWTAFGTDRHNNEWEYFSFDPPETVKLVNERANRYRPVTYPEGMTNWFATAFDAKAAGWKTGMAPLANFDGKVPEGKDGCSEPETVCGCGDAGKGLWDKEVILMRRTFELPPLREGYRYRLLVGGASHVGVGDGYCVYVNGRKLVEAKGYGGRGSGGYPDGIGIAPEFFDAFKGGKVVVAATSFLRQHHRTHKIQGHMNLWFQQQKIPPFGDDLVQKSIALIPMTCTAWQDLQDPAKTVTDPDEGKFWYDGAFKSNAKLLGDWVRMGEVASVDDFKPGETLPPLNAGNAGRYGPKGLACKAISLKPGGATDSANRLWSDDTLMDLKRDYRGSAAYEALKMVVKRIDGTDTLFVEAGGFSTKLPADWQSPWVVFKRR